MIEFRPQIKLVGYFLTAHYIKKTNMAMLISIHRPDVSNQHAEMIYDC